MATPVKRDQFVVTREGITHVPTGAAFTPIPAVRCPETCTSDNWATGCRMATITSPDEVQAMMQRLWAEYIEANQTAFDPS